MGNAPSGAMNDNDDDDADFMEEGKATFSNDSSEGGLDIGVLFDHALLRDAAGKVKEEANEGFLEQHISTIVRWLEERRGRHDEYISLSQFTDMLVGRGANREDCVELFNQFDAEGNGHVVVEYFLETLQGLPGGAVSAKGDLRTSTKSLQSCSLTPGFVDAFAENSETVLNHGQKLLKFVMRNRSSSTSLPIPALEGFCNTSEMRLKVLQAHIEAFKEKANLSNKSPSREDGEILKPLTKCYMDIEVSSNKSDALRVISGDSNSYWQSDGPARSHWVRLRMRPNVVLKQLSITVASADQSYMPQHVVVMAGRDEKHLREIGDVRIPSHITGEYTLIENVKTPYPIIQINIRRCHSDGCDTRIRGLKAIGFKVLRSKGMSVGDASAVWYLSILGATAQAALPLAPHLQDTLLAVTRSALAHMRPLSISHSSPERPSFMSQNVMDEVEGFLHSVISFGGSIHPESLKILLEFTLARGSLKSILKVVKLLYDVCDEDFNALEIIQSLQEVQFTATRMHGTQLKMSLVSCDGGEKDKNSKPENVLSENWTSEAYLSENGKKLVNMNFSCASSNPIRLTKLVIKVFKGAIGPKTGIVFVLNDFKRDEKDKEPSDTDLFSKYNNWTKADYTEFLKSTSTKNKTVEEPVAFFTTEPDWDEVEVTVDTILTGKYVLIKFLGPRKEPSERIGVLGVHFYGYELKPECSLSRDLGLDELAPLPESNPVDGSVLFLRVLAFLDEMAKDQANKQSSLTREKVGQLDISSVTLDLLWEVYCLITSRGVKHPKIVASSVLVLRLLYLSLPHLKPVKMVTTKKEKETATEKQLLSSKVFAHLCEIVDDDGTRYSTELQQISKQIILEGAEVFFPDTETRRNHLLSMVDQVMEEGKAVSLAMTFESLCRFFSNKDASGLLGLPDVLPEKGFNCTPVISVMTTLLSVAFQECLGSLQSESSKTNHSMSNLVQLLCAMQKSLLLWCHTQFKDKENSCKESALTLVEEYTAILASKVCSALQTVGSVKSKMTAIDRLEHSFVAAAARQFVLFLNLFTGIDDICLHILRSLHPIILELKKLSADLPDLFFKIDSEEWNKAQGETVLRTWNEESNHDYENNQDISKVFSCPGCSEFTVEFDPQCETERKYDYLEFTDSNGGKRRFDQKVGTDKWPLKIHFKAGDRLLFYFHSDGSNSEWGYKFKVTAKGSPDVALSWIFDLQLGMARLFGVLCSAALDSRKAALPPSTTEVEEDDSKLLHSEIWTTLFRGGYMTGKLQRSLSGHHSTSPPQESAVNSFLQKLIEGDDVTANELIKCCFKHHPGPSMGGLSVDKAVKAVFAALIWHSQELREQIVLYANNTPPESVPLGIQEAYSIAESLRRTLVDRRQKLILQSEEEDHQGASGSKTDPDSPVTSCREKAQFLLKFGGLQRLTEKFEGRENKRSKWLNRKSSWHKSSSNENLSAPMSINATRQRAFSVEEIKTIDKHPAFKLIIDFVTNESYSHERIRRLLQQRYKHANTVADIYLFASDFLRISSESDVVQAPAVLFLQQFLSMQKYFPSHYADNLDGCGLALEGKVRRAYYTLLRRGLDAVKSCSAYTTDLKTTSAAFECLRAYVLHLLDTEWKAYDYAFILDVHLPGFLLDTAKSTVQIPKMEINDLNEKQELEHYEDCMKWFEEAKNNFDQWWQRMQAQELNPEEKRQMHLFVAEFSDCLDVTITCDGCSCRLPGRRFRCLNCPDVDLCSACYLGGIMPEGHTEEHQVVDLRYKCNNCKCFIVGTRFHCNECEDFDLCLGCQTFLKYPARHLGSHRVTKFPFKADSSNNQPTGLSQTYTYHHAWLQFSALALSLANALNVPDKSGFGLGVNAEYMRSAGQLHSDCLELLNKSLKYTELPSEVSTPKEESQATPTPSDEKITEVKNADEGTLSSSSAEGLAKSSSSEDSLDKKEASTEEPEGSVKGECLPTVTVTPSSEDVASATAIEAATVATSKEGDVAGPSKNDVPSSPGAPALTEGDAPSATEAVSPSVVDISMSSEDATPSNQDSEASKSDTGEGGLIANYSSSSLSDSTKPSECSSLETISEERAKTTRKEEAEKVFAKGAHEKILGLLGALLPQDSKLSHWSNYCVGMERFLADQLLPSLYSIIRSKCCEVETRSIAMGVLAKYLKCINPAVSDRAIVIVNSSGQVTRNLKTQESLEDASRGLQESEEEPRDSVEPVGDSRGTSTVEFLFHLGAEYLASSDLDAASGMASALQQLTSVPQWQPSVSTHIGKFIQRLALSEDTIELSAIFGLLVFAGFPDVVRMGSVVQVKQIAEENRKAVVLKSYPEKGAVMVIDVKSRRKKSVKEHDVESSSGWTDASHSANMTILMGIVKDILTEIKQGTSVSVERLWMLYLALKGLLRNVKASDDSVCHDDLIKRSIIPLLINLSCRGTSFSNQWLLRDLEVLSLKLYKLEKMKVKDKSEAPTKGKGAKAAAQVVASKLSATSVTSGSSTESGGEDPYEGMDDVTKACFDTIHEAVQAPLAILRAIYENVGRDREKLLEEVQRCFDGTGFQPSEEVKELSKKWEPKPEKPQDVLQDVVMDVGVVRYSAKEFKPWTVEAKPEQEDMAQKLIPTMSDAEIAETRQKQARTKSAELLKNVLEKERKPGCTDYLVKVNLALSIIYARHLLAAILSDWPVAQVITSELLDNCDQIQLIGLLDIIQRMESSETFENVVSHVVRQGDTPLVQPLSLAATHCMGEETLSSETRESDHDYKNETVDSGEVNIPGASSLFVKFDPRCATEEGCDELILATSKDYKQNRHVFSGPQGRWIDVELPGDILYYKFTSDSSTNDWGWKFVVTGGQHGRFKTGFSVLNSLLSLDNNIARSLPIQKLWGWLVSVACCQVGQQRLMATGLLLRLLLVVSGQAVDSSGSQTEPLDASERPDLRLLKPLWALYTKMLEKEGSGAAPTLVSPVLRGLTELFLVVENLAQDWGMAEDLVVGFTTSESLKRCFSQAVQKIGAIGIAIGLPNKASEALIQAALHTPPKPSTQTKEESASTAKPEDFDLPITIHLEDEENDDTTAEEDTTDDESSEESFW